MRRRVVTDDELIAVVLAFETARQAANAVRADRDRHRCLDTDPETPPCWTGETDMCAECQQSVPLHRAYRVAMRARGAALRKLQSTAARRLRAGR